MVRTARVESYRIPSGNRGARATVRHMRRLVRQSLLSPLLIEMAGLIVAGKESPADKAHSIRSYLTGMVRFTLDPVGLELIRSPVYMLREIEKHGVAQGDCDDVATLAAALGMAAGLPARFILLGFEPKGPYSHVYADLYTEEGWAEMDTTAPAQFPPGLRVHQREAQEV